jgi:hypothetical protein
MKRTSLVLSVFLVFISCKKKHDDTQASPVVPDPVFQKATASKLNPIFRDDFDDNRNNWRIHNNDTVVTSISNGYLNFQNGTVYSGYYIDFPIPFDATKDFTITSSITKISLADDWGFGVVWGASNGKMFQMMITQTGFYKIENWDGTTDVIIKDWSKCVVNATNKIQIFKQGGTYFFFLNDVNVFSCPFQPLYGHGIGFVVFNQKDAIEVDYLEVDQ